MSDAVSDTVLGPSQSTSDISSGTRAHTGVNDAFATAGRIPTAVHSDATGQRRKRAVDSPRSKTLLACDRCRNKKTRCVPHSATSRIGVDPCQACRAADSSCTFELPITVSRSKRIRNGHSSSRQPYGDDEDRGCEDEVEDQPVAGPSRTPQEERRSALPRLRKNKTSVVRLEGPTSLSYILHSHPSLPLSALNDIDTTQRHCMQTSASGDGHILVTYSRDEPSWEEPTGLVLQALQSESWNEVVSRLVELYLLHVSPLLPIVVREEMGQADDLLLYAMAAVAAARSNCLKEIFEALRLVLVKNLHEQDVMSEPTRQNIQILLVTCLVDDLGILGGSQIPSPSAQRTRLAAAIRLAQDLSVDDLNASTKVSSDRRIWACARVLDTWNAARTGLPPILDVVQTTLASGGDFLDHLVHLANLLGRILALVYSKDGIKSITNAALLSIRDDLASYSNTLPPEYRTNGMWSSLPAGILHLLHTAITLLLYRPFMRFSFICPSHLDLDMNVPVWDALTAASKQALEWITNQEEQADLLFFGPYAVGLCALIQYHDWARRRRWEGVIVLDKAKKEAIDRWLDKIPAGHLPLRRQQLELIEVLHTATQTATPTDGFSSPRGLNPTPGVLNRLPETPIWGVAFLRDPSHPKGGILVASQRAAREVKDLPEGTVIIGGPPEQQLLDNNIDSGNLANWDLVQALEGRIQPTDSVQVLTSTDWEAAVASFGLPGFEGNLQNV